MSRTTGNVKIFDPEELTTLQSLTGVSFPVATENGLGKVDYEMMKQDFEDSMEAARNTGVDIGDIDDMNVASQILSTSPGYYVVTSSVMSQTVKVGLMGVFSDSAQHTITQVLLTHYLLEDGAISTNHDDAKVFLYYRACKISGGTLPTDPYVWTDWKDITGNDIEGGFYY